MNKKCLGFILSMIVSLGLMVDSNDDRFKLVFMIFVIVNQALAYRSYIDKEEK